MFGVNFRILLIFRHVYSIINIKEKRANARQYYSLKENSRIDRIVFLKVHASNLVLCKGTALIHPESSSIACISANRILDPGCGKLRKEDERCRSLF